MTQHADEPLPNLPIRAATGCDNGCTTQENGPRKCANTAEGLTTSSDVTREEDGVNHTRHTRQPSAPSPGPAILPPDGYLPPCVASPEPFDTMLERLDGPNRRYALRACRDICAACNVFVKIRCLRDNIDHPSVIAGLTLAERDVLRARAEGRPGRAVRRCSIDGCDNKHLARGLCTTHYHQTRKEPA